MRLYPQDKRKRKRLHFWMETLRTVGALATLLTCIVNLSLFTYQVNVLQYEYNQIKTEVKQ